MSTAGASSTTVGTTTGATVTGSSTPVVAANGSRLRLVIVNDSTDIIYLAFGATATANNGYRLSASGGTFDSHELNGLWTGAVNAISAGTSSKITVAEFLP